MWCAVGSCYQKLGNISHALRAYERAVRADDREGIATRELARLYREQGNNDGAARCYLQHWISSGYIDATTLKVSKAMEALPVDTIAEAVLFVANFFKRLNDLTRAEDYCSLLLDYIGPEGNESRALLRQIRAYPRSSSSSNSNVIRGISLDASNGIDVLNSLVQGSNSESFSLLRNEDGNDSMEDAAEDARVNATTWSSDNSETNNMLNMSLSMSQDSGSRCSSANELDESLED
jgi:tetratricopeptide (TPR) repeat protein